MVPHRECVVPGVLGFGSRVRALLALGLGCTGLIGCAQHEIFEFGESGEGICQVNRTELIFSEFLGAEQSAQVVLRNVGEGTLETSVPAVIGDGTFSIAGGGVFSLEPGQTRELTVVFAPTTLGLSEVNVALLPCQSVRFEGTGLEPPICAVSESTLDFGTYTAGSPCPERTFTIRNDGVGLLTGTVSSPCDDFLVIGEASYSLATSEEFTATIQYVPRAAGPSSCEIDLGSPFFCASVTCSGTSATPPTAIVTTDTGARLQFGSVLADGPGGDQVALGFTVENVGTGTISVDPVFATSAPDFDIQPDTAASLGPGETASYTVIFDPRNSLGGYADHSLSITGLGGCALGVEATGEVGFDFHVDPLMQTYCQPCHNRPYNSVVALSDLISPPNSPILVKPSTGVDHSTGGVISGWGSGGVPYRTTLRWIEQGVPR